VEQREADAESFCEAFVIVTTPVLRYGLSAGVPSSSFQASPAIDLACDGPLDSGQFVPRNALLSKNEAVPELSANGNWECR